MFGRQPKPCMVFEYGCLPPISGEEAAIEEMRRRNSFWNALVEIERKHQEAVRPLIFVEDETIVNLRSRLKELREEIKQRRKKERSGQIDVEALLAEAKEIKEVIYGNAEISGKNI